MTVLDLKCEKCQPIVDNVREKLAVLNALCCVDYKVLHFTCTPEEHRQYIDNASRAYHDAFDVLFDSHHKCFEERESEC